MCHKSDGNRKIEVNHRLNELREQARENLMSEKGKKHRSKRPVEVEAVFGQLKSNNKFNRFTFRGLEKVELEFLLMALGHNFRKVVAKAGKSGVGFSPTRTTTIKIIPLNSRTGVSTIHNHEPENSPNIHTCTNKIAA